MAQDRDAFIKTLFENESERLFRAAYRLTGSAETAKDLVQDTFLLATIHYKDLLSHPVPAAWLMRVIVNLSKNENRRQVNRSTISLDDAAALAAPKSAQALSEILPKQLSEEDRKILIWRFEQDMSYQEMANRLGISETGCRSRVFRAIEKCRQFRDEFLE